MNNPHIEKILHFINSAQQNDGSFLTLSSADRNFKKYTSYTTTFATSLILFCLADIHHPIANSICTKGVNFLISQQTQYGSWNYWSTTSPEHTQKPYPDDLDDTFAALIAIQKIRPKFFTGKEYANYLRILIHNEANPGGPYKTWITSSPLTHEWDDIDTTINSSIVYFLKQHGINVEETQHYIHTKILTDDINSPYYPNILLQLFFICRSGITDKAVKDKVCDMVTNYHGKNTPLDSILKICCFHYLKEYSLAKKEFSMMEFSTDDPYIPYPLWSDPSSNNKATAAGASSLTAAFFALAFSFVSTYEDTPAIVDSYALLLQDEINGKIKSYCAELLLSDKEVSYFLHSPIIQQSLLTPYNAWKQLHPSLRDKIPLTFVQLLCLASISGWIAYTIYDEIIDDNKKRNMLPVANFFMRIAYKTHLEALPANDWRTFVENTYLHQDKSMIQEQTIYSFDEYEKTKIIPYYLDEKILAQKSYGHAIGPLMLLGYVGYSTHSQEVLDIKDFYTHYLIARQLNDDAHDWKEDIVTGKITPPISTTLSLYDTYFKHTDLDQHVENLQKIFWTQSIDLISGNILEHIEKSANSLEQTIAFQDPKFLCDLLRKLLSAIKKIQDEKNLINQFILEYKPRAIQSPYTP